MKEIKLKPCPFCGSADIEVEKYLPEGRYTDSWRIACADCDGGFQDQHNEREARHYWNNRNDNIPTRIFYNEDDDALNCDVGDYHFRIELNHKNLSDWNVFVSTDGDIVYDQYVDNSAKWSVQTVVCCVCDTLGVTPPSEWHIDYA